jgi:succinate-semialdehyde dehydrogenase/glutarate-semialdehyde dehydrogenase
MRIESRSPTTGELLESFETIPDSALESALAASEKAFAIWRQTSFAQRSAPLYETARLLRARKTRLAATMAREMGKPVAQGEAEVEKCAGCCEFYAEHAERYLAEAPRATEAEKSAVRYDPLGPVLAVMPWNFPLWQVFRFAAPALMAGNTGLLKHASNVTRSALDIEEVLRDAGCPEGVFQTLVLESARVARVIEDPRVRAVTLTGSEGAGSQVGAAAGRALKKSVLELGGSDPYVVLEDADVERAAQVAADARLINSGQSCIAAKRFIVVEPVFDRFLARFVEEMGARRMGDPEERSTQIGPQARPELRDELHRQVERSVERGAKLVLGGSMPAGPGAFYPATVLTGVAHGMAAFDEETFGPVAALVRARDEADAIALANHSSFGLGASLWTRDRGRAERIVPQLEVGCVFVNAQVKSDPRLPFGGVKRSGYGRELAEHGIREFTNTKAVWMEGLGATAR